jgi:hypothetical protein
MPYIRRIAVNYGDYEFKLYKKTIKNNDGIEYYKDEISHKCYQEVRKYKNDVCFREGSELQIRKMSYYLNISNTLFVITNTRQHVYSYDIQEPKKRIVALCIIKDYGINEDTDEIKTSWKKIKGKKSKKEEIEEEKKEKENKIRILLLCSHYKFKGKGSVLLLHVLEYYKQKMYISAFIESLDSLTLVNYYKSFGFVDNANKIDYTESEEDINTKRLEYLF